MHNFENWKKSQRSKWHVFFFFFFSTKINSFQYEPVHFFENLKKAYDWMFVRNERRRRIKTPSNQYITSCYFLKNDNICLYLLLPYVRMQESKNIYFQNRDYITMFYYGTWYPYGTWTVVIHLNDSLILNIILFSLFHLGLYQGGGSGTEMRTNYLLSSCTFSIYACLVLWLPFVVCKYISTIYIMRWILLSASGAAR